MNTHAPGFNPDDGPADSPCVIDDDRCSVCGYQFDLDDLKAVDYREERSGHSPSTPDSVAVYWTEGTVLCPNCESRCWLQMSS